MTVSEAIKELDGQYSNTKFRRLVTICTEVFGHPRTRGSHHIFTTPWPGDPRINLQKDGSHAKPYQVRQVLAALKKLLETETAEKRPSEHQE